MFLVNQELLGLKRRYWSPKPSCIALSVNMEARKLSGKHMVLVMLITYVLDGKGGQMHLKC